uniref:Uncharacterized protein n=1 Tax=Anguilla anguilla TaxID=7936 RepID=A0A0E9SNK8_ANGAN
MTSSLQRGFPIGSCCSPFPSSHKFLC